MKLRIRGIYATALSALLPKHGFEIVEASPVIAERLDLPTGGTSDVRLRDRPDGQCVWLEGTRAQAGTVARALAELLPDAVPRELRGPVAWEVEFPGGSKRRLDEVRAAVWPTIPGHHQLKIVAREAVDRAEHELSASGRSAEAAAAQLRERFIQRALCPGRAVFAAHVKPYGRELRLPGRVEALLDGCLRLTRTFRPGGTYDTLDSAKLAGDYGEIEQLEASWVSRRRYLRANGKLIGELYNIQTPTELYPTGVRYVDLEVDVAVWPNGSVEVVDQLELQVAVQAGQISPALAKRALAVAEGVRARLAAGASVDLADWV